MLLERVFTNDSLGRAVDPWIPKRAADWARRTRTRYLRRAPRLPRELATELRERFRDDIGKTAELIGRDLSLRLDR